MVFFFLKIIIACIAFKPKLDQIISKYNKYTFIKVDLDANKDIFVKVGINSIPAFLKFKNSLIVDHITGASELDLINLLND